MKLSHSLPLIFAAALVTRGWSADTAPAYKGPDVPEKETGALYSAAKKLPADKTERTAKNLEILAGARKIIAQYPDVPDTAPGREILVRRIMLPAAERLYRDEPTAENRTQLIEIATDVVKLPLYDGHLIVKEKVNAAATLARLEIFPTPKAEPVDAAKHIKALVDAFPPKIGDKDTGEFTGQALVYAAKLASETKEKALADEYCEQISAKYLATADALDTLIQAGHAPIFEAEMTTLDGKPLNMPADTKGKVVVLDFWATWCVPCVQSMPHVKELTEKFKDQDVRVIGISCDSPMQKETPEENKAKVAAFVAGKGYEWTQTWTGEWPKAAVKYGVGHIPTVFVIGKDGHIISATARGREEGLIQKALTAP